MQEITGRDKTKSDDAKRGEGSKHFSQVIFTTVLKTHFFMLSRLLGQFKIFGLGGGAKIFGHVARGGAKNFNASLRGGAGRQ